MSMVICNRMKIDCRKLEFEIFEVQIVAFFMFWKESDLCGGAHSTVDSVLANRPAAPRSILGQGISKVLYFLMSPRDLSTAIALLRV